MGFIADFILGNKEANNAKEFGEGQLDLANRVFDQSQANQQPFINAGVAALGAQGDALGLGLNGGGVATQPQGTPNIGGGDRFFGLGQVLPEQGVQGGVSSGPTTGDFLDSQGGAAGPQAGFDRSVANFQASPFYTLPFNEGLKTLEGSAANRGDLLSGQTLKDITNFGQNQANNNFDRYYNALAGVSGSGQIATGQQANAGQNLVTNSGVAGSQILQGQNAGIQNIGNGIDNLLGGLGSIFGGG